jgi:single-strand selective monofunctional uracil DNA glycosylase
VNAVRANISAAVVRAARRLARETRELRFAPPVAYVYRPLDYAWAPHRSYLERFAASRKRVVYVGMNPGPFGMAQTGVPFGEVAHVRDWMRIGGKVEIPADVHPKRPVEGFACARSEVSGARLWGGIATVYGTSERFFAESVVLNYCPLAFVEPSGRNRTPDKLPAEERERLFAACDRHLARVVTLLDPEWLVGIGAFAEERLRALVEGRPGSAELRASQRGASVPRIARVPHPSPASPQANRDWLGAARTALRAQGVCGGRCSGQNG